MAAHTIKMAGYAAFGDEIRVFSVYGPSPTAMVYSDVKATFPNTKAGQREAEDFAFSLGIERGQYDVVDEFKKRI